MDQGAKVEHRSFTVPLLKLIYFVREKEEVEG